MLDLKAIFDLEEHEEDYGTATAAPPHGGLTPGDLAERWREYYEERAAVREYDGGQAREHAEAEALAETLTAMRRCGHAGC